MTYRAGPTNSILDIEGLSVGNVDEFALNSGVTVVICEEPAVASVHVMGGAPGTRDTDLLAPEETVETVDALVLSGGSAFGLDAASGVQAHLREAGRGLPVGPVRVPIVPGAIIFDLLNGGNKDWGRFPPYRDMAYEAATLADRTPFSCGRNGAGFGATTATAPGGLGTASTLLPSGITVAALVVVNAVGSALVGDGPHFWAAPFELDAEFGGLGPARPQPSDAVPRLKTRPALRGNTTIGIIATDARLTKPQAKRLAIQAHDGFARALYPAHTDFDGDLVFSLATGRHALPSADAALDLATAAATTMARAIARGVWGALRG